MGKLFADTILEHYKLDRHRYTNAERQELITAVKRTQIELDQVIKELES